MDLGGECCRVEVLENLETRDFASCVLDGFGGGIGRFVAAMGSLAAGVFGPLLPSSSRRSDRHLQRHRSRLWRILRFEKVDYFRCVWIVVVFFFVIVLFQSFLPGSTAEKSCSSGNYGRRPALAGPKVVSEAVPVDFGDGIRFHPSKLLEKFRREANGSAALSRPGIRAALRKPLLAVLLMVSLAKSLQEIGYDFQDLMKLFRRIICCNIDIIDCHILNQNDRYRLLKDYQVA